MCHFCSLILSFAHKSYNYFLFYLWGIHKLPITSTKRDLLNKATEDQFTKHSTAALNKTQDDSALEVLRFDRNFPANNSATPL